MRVGSIGPNDAVWWLNIRRPLPPVVHVWLVPDVGWTVLVDRKPHLIWPKECDCLASQAPWPAAIKLAEALVRSECARLSVFDLN